MDESLICPQAMGMSFFCRYADPRPPPPQCAIFPVHKICITRAVLNPLKESLLDLQLHFKPSLQSEPNLVSWGPVSRVPDRVPDGACAEASIIYFDSNPFLYTYFQG